MTDYKNTLNLPQTDFPMKANLPQREPKILEHWAQLNIYNHLRDLGQSREKFILHDGPPYANGSIHLGHAVNKTLKDMVVKSKTLSGFDSPYVPGWDCHGLPIELNVEKKHGKAGDKKTPKEFRQACRDYASTQIAGQSEAFQRLGVIADWDHPYLTMNPKYEAGIVRSLAKIIEKGHLQRGYKPVHWCFACQSALAEAEVEYKDKTSQAIDVRFAVLDVSDLLRRIKFDGLLKQVVIPIWTTTPWTLPANQAVALHPTLKYVLVQAGDQHMIVAEDLLTPLMSRSELHDYHVLTDFTGEVLEGLLLQHPFLERQVPVVLGDHVTTDAGTGAVHTAPAHGLDDYALGLKYHLPVAPEVSGGGVFNKDVPQVGGEHVFKANEKIVELLKTRGALLHIEDIQHSYPHCWRHKKPLIFRATPQWFVGMHESGLLKNALSEIKEVKWLPENGEQRITAMMTDRPDWCVSRQRVWGVPMMLFVHKETGNLHADQLKLMEKLAKLVEKDGIEAWFDLDVQAFLGDDADQYERVNDVLDVWFDSGVSHHCVLDVREGLHSPADIYLEGSDQHRGWFQTSLLTSCAMKAQAPYREVITHGFTVDAQGRKMSKSLGNTITPDKVIKQSGADIVRLWVASADYHNEITVSDEVFKQIADTYRRIRNTARFLLGNIGDFTLNDHQVPAKNLLALDAWLIEKTKQLQIDVIHAYDGYHFVTVVQKLHHFCSIELGSFYLDIVKDRQYTMPANSVGRRSAQTAMYHVLEVFVRCLAPVCSFTAEEIWQCLSGEREESVFFSQWYDNFPQATSTLNDEVWQTLIAVRDAVNKEIERLRSEKTVGSNLEASVVLFADAKLKKILDQLGDELRFVLITSAAQVESIDDVTVTAIETGVEGLRLSITASPYEKCVRCWHRRDDVGHASEHPELCSRCLVNVAGQGEERRYA